MSSDFSKKITGRGSLGLPLPCGGVRVEVIPLAADSLGTRSMATLVRVGEWSMVVDPGVALGPRRYGLPPHPLEEERLEEHKRAIREAVEGAQVLVITHYHHDHYEPRDLEIYRGKTLIIKDPETNINRNQAKRARDLLKGIEGLAKGVMVAEGRSLVLGDLEIVFSGPVPHGNSARLGWVVQLAVKHGDETFLFTSDVQGPLLPQHMDFILDMNPTLLYVDGPTTYLLGTRFSKEDLEIALKNLSDILSSTRVETVILDHHITRDGMYMEKVAPVLGLARSLGKRVVTAAGYLGREEDLLEARRRELYGGEDS